MGRRDDNAPIGHTCPKIDSVISSIHDLYISSEEMSREHYTQFEKEMEEIRTANGTLRDWGNKQCDELIEMEKDRDYYEKRCRELENEVSSLQDDVKELQKELSEAEN